MPNPQPQSTTPAKPIEKFLRRFFQKADRVWDSVPLFPTRAFFGACPFFAIEKRGKKKVQKVSFNLHKLNLNPLTPPKKSRIIKAQEERQLTAVVAPVANSVIKNNRNFYQAGAVIFLHLRVLPI
jgi:hypothetical protein